MPRKILFIINPNAGKKISRHVIKCIRKTFPQNIYYQIAVWKDRENFAEIAARLISDDYTDAVAVGGDGTVNKVASAILGTKIRLGIVPVGSGNGLARTLGITLQVEGAIEQIVNGKEASIDHGKVNGQPFFCTSGVGLDAHIGTLFANSAIRGFGTYARITLSQIFRYKPQRYKLKIGDRTIHCKALLVTVANAGQYGNNFYIAPQAKLDDGLLHIALLKPFNPLMLAPMLFKIVRRKAHLSTYIDTYSGRSVQITRDDDGPLHFDGEPCHVGKQLFFENVSAGLTVITGDEYKS